MASGYDLPGAIGCQTPMESVERPLVYARANRSRFLKELKEFIGIPSVSAQPQHAGDVKKCAIWLVKQLRKIGLTRALIFPTDRHRLSVNLKCLFEGEEEIGSPDLTGFIEGNRRALAADVALISDTSMLGLNRPALSYSLRGQLAAEIEVTGPSHDLHSGNFGGAVHNPLQALCEIIARLHDRGGRVAIPGFYDRVRLPTGWERDFLRRTGPDDERIFRAAAVKSGWGDNAYTLYERVAVRPSLTINGISGGYAGAGGKGVIPSRALAKLSFRLVAEQDPREMEALFRAHIARITPATVRSVVHFHGSSWPAVIDRRHPALRAASQAYKKAFGRRPILLRSGGSIPAVSIFQQTLGIPTVFDGIRPSGRPYPRSKRKASPVQLLPRSRNQHLVSERSHNCTSKPGSWRGRPAARSEPVRTFLSQAMIIDCHCHTGRADLIDQSWTNGAPLLAYLRRARAAGISKTVVFSQLRRDYNAGNEEVARIVARFPERLIGFVFVDAMRDAGHIFGMVKRAVRKNAFRGKQSPWHRRDAHARSMRSCASFPHTCRDGYYWPCTGRGEVGTSISRG
jgi:acetylornithine deacetylase/succinyl-diaminopimelate desuccinylase-like protein